MLNVRTQKSSPALSISCLIRSDKVPGAALAGWGLWAACHWLHWNLGHSWLAEEFRTQGPAHSPRNALGLQDQLVSKASSSNRGFWSEKQEESKSCHYNLINSQPGLWFMKRRLQFSHLVFLPFQRYQENIQLHVVSNTWKKPLFETSKVSFFPLPLTIVK